MTNCREGAATKGSHGMKNDAHLLNLLHEQAVEMHQHPSSWLTTFNFLSFFKEISIMYFNKCSICKTILVTAEDAKEMGMENIGKISGSTFAEIRNSALMETFFFLDKVENTAKLINFLTYLYIQFGVNIQKTETIIKLIQTLRMNIDNGLEADFKNLRNKSFSKSRIYATNVYKKKYDPTKVDRAYIFEKYMLVNHIDMNLFFWKQMHFEQIFSRTVLRLTQGKHDLLCRLPKYTKTFLEMCMLLSITQDIEMDSVEDIERGRSLARLDMLCTIGLNRYGYYSFVLQCYMLLVGPLLTSLTVYQLIDEITHTYEPFLERTVQTIESLTGTSVANDIPPVNNVPDSQKTKQNVACDVSLKMTMTSSQRAEIVDFVIGVAGIEECYITQIYKRGYRIDPNSGVTMPRLSTNKDLHTLKAERTNLFINFFCQNVGALNEYVYYYYFMIISTSLVMDIPKNRTDMMCFVLKNYHNFLNMVHLKVTLLFLEKQPTANTVVYIGQKFSPLRFSMFNMNYEPLKGPKLSGEQVDVDVRSKVFQLLLALYKNAGFLFNQQFINSNTCDQRKSFIDFLLKDNIMANTFLDRLYITTFADDFSTLTLNEKFKKLYFERHLWCDKLLLIYMLYIKLELMQI